jgi:chaperonin GroES
VPASSKKRSGRENRWVPMKKILLFHIVFKICQKKSKKNIFPPSQVESEAYTFPLPGRLCSGIHSGYAQRTRKTVGKLPRMRRHTVKIVVWRKRSMKLKPLNDRVLVKRLESEEKTAGGLYIPDTAKEKPSRGKVVAAGPGKLADDGKRTALAVKAGDLVLFNKYAGTEISLDGEEHLVMREDDILAIIA